MGRLLRGSENATSTGLALLLFNSSEFISDVLNCRYRIITHMLRFIYMQLPHARNTFKKGKKATGF